MPQKYRILVSSLKHHSCMSTGSCAGRDLWLIIHVIYKTADNNAACILILIPDVHGAPPKPHTHEYSRSSIQTHPHYVFQQHCEH